MAIIHNNLGLAFHSKGQVQMAAEHYRKAIEIDDQDARAHNNLGVAMQDLDEIEEAKKCYRRAAEIDLQHPVAQTNLGALVRLGSNTDAAPANTTVSSPRAANTVGGVLDRSGMEGALAGAAECAIESSAVVRYGVGQWVRLYLEGKGTWADGEVTGFDEATGAHLIRFDGDGDKHTPIEELGPEYMCPRQGKGRC